MNYHHLGFPNSSSTTPKPLGDRSTVPKTWTWPDPSNVSLIGKRPKKIRENEGSRRPTDHRGIESAVIPSRYNEAEILAGSAAPATPYGKGHLAQRGRDTRSERV